ncbi:hypothetical protein, partial [Candidatus Methylacidiphilum fumarolicum]
FAKIASSPLEHPQNHPIFTKHGLTVSSNVQQKSCIDRFVIKEKKDVFLGSFLIESIPLLS